MALGMCPNGFGEVPQWVWEGSPKALGSVPKGFGKPCFQAAEVCMASSRTFVDKNYI